MTNVVIIVQARMGSTRLPGKVLMSIAGRPMLSFQIERLRRVECAQVVVATTVNATDDPIVALCAAEGIECTRGSEQDVLSRYCESAKATHADVVVRVTSDCPLIDPALVEKAIDTFQRSAETPDFVSNMLQPTWPFGMAVEVFSIGNLRLAHERATEPEEREHVTPFFYRRPQQFRLKSLTMSPDLSRHRWTVDTPEDFELVSRILKELYPKKPNFTISDVVDLLSENPTWEYINRHVVQKTVAPTVGES